MDQILIYLHRSLA
jgi:hypothetical protein